MGFHDSEVTDGGLIDDHADLAPGRVDDGPALPAGENLR